MLCGAVQGMDEQHEARHMTEESKMKAEVKAYLTSKGACVIPIAQSSYSLNGAPDMVVCYKGRFIAVEGKTYKGQQSGWQREMQEKITKAGGIYAVIRSVEAAMQLIEEIDRRCPEWDS